MDYEKLISYAAGELSGPKAAEVEAWLARDPAAAQVVARYRMVQASLRQDESPSPEAEAQAKAIFDRARAARPARPRLAQQVAEFVARLMFDSRAEPALAGLRGSASSFQLTYGLWGGDAEREGAELDLQAEPSPRADSWRVVGQVAGGDPGDAMRVDLCRAGSPTPIQTVRGDRRGTFVLSVEPGTYDLHLHLPGRVAVVPDIRMT